jgi:hypothetical protein
VKYQQRSNTMAKRAGGKQRAKQSTAKPGLKKRGAKGANLTAVKVIRIYKVDGQVATNGMTVATGFQVTGFFKGDTSADLLLLHDGAGSPSGGVTVIATGNKFTHTFSAADTPPAEYMIEAKLTNFDVADYLTVEVV